jgi:hypothetical protein
MNDRVTDRAAAHAGLGFSRLGAVFLTHMCDLLR